jgi:ABC-type uncharacterized transport system permease subunit
MIALEARPEPSRALAWLSPLIALLITVVVAAALFVALGRDPVQGLRMFLFEPLNGARGASEVALKSTPLILCALGLALCFRSNVWNIGAEGQFLLGAITGGGLALYFTANQIAIDRWAFFPLVIVAGAAGGMVWAGIVALLRDRFNASEILVSLMLVYVANLLLSYLVFGPWKDPKGFNFPQTMSFASGTNLPRIVTGLRMHWGLAIALLAAAVMWVFMFRTFRGYQLQVGARCGPRCWCRAAWPAWRGRSRRSARPGSSPRTCRPATASPRSSSPSSAGCIRWAACSAACCCRCS